MAYAEGVVRGHVYGGSGWQDCSRPCMWLDGGYCRLKKTAEPKCLGSQPEEDYPEAKYGCKAVVRDDGKWYESMSKACKDNGSHAGCASRITRAIRSGGFAFGHRWKYARKEQSWFKA